MARMKELYEKKGYPKAWIDKRLRGIAVRQDCYFSFARHRSDQSHTPDRADRLAQTHFCGKDRDRVLHCPRHNQQEEGNGDIRLE